MTEEQQFCLRWNDFQTNMVTSFKHLRDEKSFCDVTIATEVNSCSFLIEILRTLDCPWIKGLGASFDIPFIKSSRVNTPKPTRWSYAPAPPTSRTCWIRIPPSTPSSSWRLLGICFKDLKALTPSSQDVPFAHLNAILEFMYAGEVRFLALWRNFLRGL